LQTDWALVPHDVLWQHLNCTGRQVEWTQEAH